MFNGCICVYKIRFRFNHKRLWIFIFFLRSARNFFFFIKSHLQPFGPQPWALVKLLTWKKDFDFLVNGPIKCALKSGVFFPCLVSVTNMIYLAVGNKSGGRHLRTRQDAANQTDSVTWTLNWWFSGLNSPENHQNWNIQNRKNCYVSLFRPSPSCQAELYWLNFKMASRENSFWAYGLFVFSCSTLSGYTASIKVLLHLYCQNQM